MRLNSDLQTTSRNSIEKQEHVLFQRIPAGIVIFDTALQIIDANPAACELLRRSKEMLIGISLCELFGKEASSLRSLANEGTGTTSIPIDLPDDQPARLAFQPCFALDEQRHALVLEDVTERDSLKSELEHRTRLETLGRITGGVAHDFNNMVTAIMSYAELQMQRAPQDRTVQRYAQSIQAAAERASETARKVLLFSRRDCEISHTDVDVNAAVRETADFLSRLIGEDIQLVLELDPDVPSVQADRGELSRVLINLAVNARDAMPHGGQILIGTSKQRSNAPRDRNLSLSRLREYASVFVHDTGSGIRSEVLPHIFDPFFTTKPRGQGTGLGLATVYRIVRECNGQILVDSEPGRGTTFEVLLPACTTATRNPSESTLHDNVCAKEGQ